MSTAACSCARFVVAWCFLLLAALALRAQPTLPVVPHPQEAELLPGAFPIDPARTRLVLHADDTTGLALAVAELRTVFRRIAGTAPAGGTDAPLSVHIGFPDHDDAFRDAVRARGAWPDGRLGEEGYVLRIEPARILLTASAPAGLYYGVQTLKQLLRAHAPEGVLPAAHVADWPALRLRGVMDDISRGPVPTLGTMKQQVRRLAELKINLLTYYTEHVAATERHRAFAPADGALTVAEWRELAAYARRHHITLVGNFQSFGHFEKILAHPAYAPLGESGRLLSPVLPESIALLHDIYDELVPAFDAPFFHVNSDETWDLGRGASKARVDSLGKGIVYAEHVERMHRLLDAHDTRMMLWADMVLEHRDALDRLPRDILMMTWTYDPLDDFDPWITPLQEAGFEFMVCPGVLNSNRLLPDFRQTLPNIAGFVAAGAERGAEGVLTTVWDDGGAALFSVDWYGVAYGADQSWRPTGNEADYDRRFDAGVYGDPTAGLSGAIRTLVSLAELAPTDGMNDRVLWQRVVPERGESLRLSLADWDRVAQRAAAADSLLDAAAPLVYADDAEALRFVAALYGYLAGLRTGLLDAARAYRSAVLLQAERPDSARALLVDALERVGRARQATLRTRNDFRTRWLRENRTYALDRVLDRYDARIDALADVETRVARALRDFDMGQVLPPPAEVRLALEEATGTYFREWVVLGPLPHPDGSDAPPADYLAHVGGEAAARPRVTDEVVVDGRTYRWHRIASPLFDAVDLAALYPEQNRNAAVYAHATLDSPDARTVRATLGSNDGADVYLNGRLVHSRHLKRNLTPDEDDVLLPLQEGRNHLLLKISQGAGGWGFSFRLPDEVVRSRKNRYRVLE